MKSVRPAVLSSVFSIVLLTGVRAQAQTPGRAEAAPWLENLSVTASTATTWTENISRTSFAPTRKNAETYDLDLTASLHRQLAPAWLLTLGLDADYLSEPAYDLNSRLQAGPNVALQRKFGLGPLAPVLQFNAGYTYKAIRVEADRGWTAEAGVRLAKRLLPELKVAATAQWLEHYANSSTFDIQQRTLGAEATWDITDRWRLTGTASWLQGRIVANAAPYVYAQALAGGFGPAIQSYYSSIPFETTNAYGPGWIAYNLQARAELWSLALAYSLTDRLSLELRTDHAYVINHVDVRYPTKSWGLGLSYRFQ